MKLTRENARRLFAGSAVAAAAFVAASAPANAATTSSFSNGTLSVLGDSLDNNITVSRDAAGKILVNGGALAAMKAAAATADPANSRRAFSRVSFTWVSLVRNRLGSTDASGVRRRHPPIYSERLSAERARGGRQQVDLLG